MSQDTKTASLGDRAMEAARVAAAAWETQRQADATDEREAQVGEMFRAARTQLGELIFDPDACYCLNRTEVSEPLLLGLPDGIALMYLPEYSDWHEYGSTRRGGEFYLAEASPHDGFIDRGTVRIGDQHISDQQAFVQLGEALKAGVPHPKRDENGDPITNTKRTPTAEDKAVAALERAEEVITGGEGFCDPVAMATLALARVQYAAYCMGER